MTRRGAEQALEMTVASTRGRVLAIDYGRRRLGLAVSDEQRKLARPIETLVRVNRRHDVSYLRRIVREQSIQQLVVGLPLRLDGTEGEMAEEARAFAARMEKLLRVPAALVDERLTSWEAQDELRTTAGNRRASGGSGHRRAVAGAASKAHRAPDGVDSLAAALILEEYLRRMAGKAARVGES